MFGCAIWSNSFGQQTFSKYLGPDVPGSVELDTSSNRILICHLTRYGPSNSIGGFVYHELDSSGNYLETHEYTTGPITNVMQNGQFVHLMPDGSYSLLFGRNGNGPYRPSLNIYRLDETSQILWNRLISYDSTSIGIAPLFPQNVHSTLLGQILLSTQIEFIGGSSFQHRSPVLIRTNNFGDVIWNSSFDLGGACALRGCSRLLDNGNITVGFSASPTCENDDFIPYICQVGENGDLDWSKRIDGSDALLSGCIQTLSGSIFLGQSQNGILFFSTDSIGEIQWARSIAMNEASFLYVPSLVSTSDGGAALIAGTSPDELSCDLLVAKITNTGDLEWADLFQTEGTFQWPIHIVEDDDGTLLTLSYAQTDGWNYGSMLRRISNNGFHDCAIDVLSSMIVTELDLIAVDVQLTQISYPMSSQPLYVNDTTSWNIYLSMDSCAIETDINTLDTVEKIVSISPNPLSLEAVIDVRINTGGFFCLYSSTGAEIERFQLTNGRNIFRRGSLVSGIYFYEIILKEGLRRTGKIVLE